MRTSNYPTRLDGALLALAAAFCAPIAVASELHVYEVRLDDRLTGVVAQFRDSDGELSIETATLRRLGIATPLVDAGDWIRLRDVPGLSARVDEAAQQIAMSLAASVRPTTTISSNAAQREAPQRLANGFTLDYDLNAQVFDTNVETGARLTPRAFGPHGVFAYDTLWTQANGWQRLDTYWQTDFPERMQTLRIGDAITAGPNWTRAVRFGGLHFASDFSLRPDLATFPLPAFQGQAAVPSSLDVLVNGARLQTAQVPSGPFSIPQLPVVSGGGDVTVVLRDALGREQSYTVPFFVSPNLLRDGLHQFAVDAGQLRRGYAARGDRYSDTFVSASERYGFNDNFTFEGRIEASTQFALGGAGAIGRIGTIGSWHAAVQVSRGAGCDGAQGYLAAEWQRGAFAAHTVLQQSSDEFCDLASIAGTAPARRLAQVGVGYASGIGDFNLTLAQREHRDDTSDRVASLNWSRRLGDRLWISLGALYTHSNSSGADAVGQFNLTVPFDQGRTTFALNGLTGPDGTARASVQRAAPVGEGWGGYAQAAVDRTDLRGGVTYRGNAAQLHAEAQHDANGDVLRLGAAGALGYLDGTLFAARRLGSSFAVVETGGIPDVAVLRENQLVGSTDANGRLIVTDLRPYQSNRLALDPRTLPAEVDVQTVQLEARPYRGGGVAIPFALSRASNGQAHLVLADGGDVPVGSVVQVDATAAQTVGHGGLIDAALIGRGAVEVSGPFGRCAPTPDAQGVDLASYPQHLCEMMP